jgi:arsenate reductase
MTRNILFLCTGNSARSIMAEAYANYAGAGAWRAYSAGSKPTGRPNPLAIETLTAHAVAPIDANGGAPRSKSWDEFAAPGAPVMDVVVTVCDNAAGETCPIWPRRAGAVQERLHWSFPDPAAVEDETARRIAFENVFADIRLQIDRFFAQRGEA